MDDPIATAPGSDTPGSRVSLNDKPVAGYNQGRSNKSLDASGGSVFVNTHPLPQVVLTAPPRQLRRSALALLTRSNFLSGMILRTKTSIPFPCFFASVVVGCASCNLFQRRIMHRKERVKWLRNFYRLRSCFC